MLPLDIKKYLLSDRENLYILPPLQKFDLQRPPKKVLKIKRWVRDDNLHICTIMIGLSRKKTQ